MKNEKKKKWRGEDGVCKGLEKDERKNSPKFSSTSTFSLRSYRIKIRSSFKVSRQVLLVF